MAYNIDTDRLIDVVEKEVVHPMLKHKCAKAFKIGFEKGKQAGWDKRVLTYENEIDCLKKQRDWAILKIEELAQKCVDMKL